MAEEQKVQIPRVQLGTQGFEVSKLGFGCMGLTRLYNDPVPEELGISIIKHAYDKGITFFDTSDAYGPHSNEVLVGKALKQLPRDKVQLATKFGILKIQPNQVLVNGTPEYVRSCCEASLKRLGVDYIDLYYQHRIDTTVPIEDIMEELKKLVEEGKIKYIGLSEASPDTIRRAHAVHPITAIQMEWSLWTREIEEEIVPLCSAIQSPLGRGFFGGRGAVESLPTSFLASGYHPRFTGDNLEKNKVIFGNVQKLSVKHKCSTAQVALAWILSQGDGVVPIPGTTKIKNLDSNIGSLRVTLTEEDVKEISDAVPVNAVAGERISDAPLTPLFVQTILWRELKPTCGHQWSSGRIVPCHGTDPGTSIVTDENGIAITKHAFSKGITFFDTADVYGPHANEILLGKALKQLPREKVKVATKFGIVGQADPPIISAKGTPEYVRSSCEGSLKRLDVDYIDLYYYHRVDTSVPIEETEPSPNTVRRAHTVHPITDLQIEWSFWTRDIEEDIVPLCRELRIGIVPYSPLGRGFFGGKGVVESVSANSYVVISSPQSIVKVNVDLTAPVGENLDKNKNTYNRVEILSKKHACSPAQLALAWVLHQGNDVVRIPGTTKIKNRHCRP
ncbi:unnamed protein product [Malus baccata var. baccata]